MREKVHHYRFCPQCKANVEPHFRFCRSCFFWLVKASRQEALRQIQVTSDHEKPGISRYWLQLSIFHASVPSLISGLMMLLTCGFLFYYYITSVLPAWLLLTPSLKRNACYSNMRVIQTAVEEYCIEHPFTSEIASDPGRFVFNANLIRSIPRCPIKENYYKIPKQSRLQCQGPEGHGIP